MHRLIAHLTNNVWLSFELNKISRYPRAVNWIKFWIKIENNIAIKHDWFVVMYILQIMYLLCVNVDKFKAIGVPGTYLLYITYCYLHSILVVYIIKNIHNSPREKCEQYSLILTNCNQFGCIYLTHDWWILEQNAHAWKCILE